ncbi:uncharacterized protein [Littorina saxatilis]|uniref:Immunoglobulin domain-containing protein n=1 Tax=Littorina saxatilis TaxID=31220 RepID=A0AAN9BHG6_9CAEN
MTVETSEEIDLPIDLKAAERDRSPHRTHLENECVKVRLSEVEEILCEKTPDNGASRAKKQGITAEKYRPERRRKRHSERLPSQEIVGIALRDACEIHGLTPPKRRCGQPIQSGAKDAFTFITTPNDKPYRRKDHRTKLKSNQSTKSVCKLCAIYMWWIFCVSKADAQLAAHTYRTTCEAHTPVFEGEQAFVHCQFPDDPRRYKFDFNVIRHDFDGMNPVGDIILNCIWNTEKTNATCQLKDGYTFDQSAIDTNISVRIPSVRREHAGRYVCGYATAWREEDKECSLSVKGLVINCSSPSPSIRVGDPSRIACHYNSDLSRTKEGFYVYRFDHDKDKPVTVLQCKWDMGTAANSPTCTLEPGYIFNRTNIGRTVTLEVPYTEQRHSGNYSCNVIPYFNQVQLKQCTLAVQGWQQGITSRTTTRPAQRQPDQYSEKFVREGQSTSVTCFFPKNIDSPITQIGVKRVINKGTSSNESEQVLQCNESSPCHKTEGYDLADKGTQTFTVTITNFTEQQEGIYVCTFKAKDIESEIPTVCLHLSKDAPDPRPSRSQAAQTYQPSLTVAMAACYLLCVMMF